MACISRSKEKEEYARRKIEEQGNACTSKLRKWMKIIKKRRRSISTLHSACYRLSFGGRNTSRDDMESLLNNVLIACQLCLGLWQFSKLTRVGALIQGAFGWLVRPLGLSPTYSRLQPCEGRVFKRANCFVLQAGIPSDRSAISRPEVNTLNLRYLGTDFLLERKGELFINDKMYPEFSHTKKVS